MRPDAHPGDAGRRSDTGAAGLKAGAKEFLLKDVSLQSLMDSIKTVHAGGYYVQPVVTESILKGLIRINSDFASLKS